MGGKDKMIITTPYYKNQFYLISIIVISMTLKWNIGFQRRLNKELMKMATDPPDGITIDPETLEGKDLST